MQSKILSSEFYGGTEACIEIMGERYYTFFDSYGYDCHSVNSIINGIVTCVYY